MKHLLKFFESNQDGKITDRDLELIENCFLDYIEQSHVGEFIPQSCRLYDFRHIGSGFISLDFKIPEPSHAKVKELIDHIMQINNLAGRPKIRLVQDINKYFLWKWIYGFVNQISGDVKRCESYGFKCDFSLYLSTNTIHLSIQGKGSEIDPLPKIVDNRDAKTTSAHALDVIKSIEHQYNFNY